MSRLSAAGLWTAFALCSVPATPALAQTALDRVDPTRIAPVDREPPTETPAPKPSIEVQASSGADASTPAVMVGAMTFAGLVSLSPVDFNDIVARYVGRTVSGDELAVLAGEVADRARARGFAFASAWIAPQRLTAGVLEIRVDEGRIDAVRVIGDAHSAVDAALAPLVGRPGRLDEVERRILLADDIDGVRIRRSRFVRERGFGILLVEVERSSSTVRLVVENDSTAPVGPEQVRLDVELDALLATDDALTVTYVTVLTAPEELQYVRARYAKRISHHGTELAASFSRTATHPGSYLAPLNIRGSSWFGELTLLHPLHRRRDGSLWFTAGLDVRDIAQRRAGRLLRHDRIAAYRVGLYGNTELGGGRLRGNATLSHGLDWLGSSDAGDPLLSRRDAAGEFTTLTGWVDWTRKLGGQFDLRLAGRGQLANEALLVAEEIGLGGQSFLRAYDYSERSGDQGVMGLAEVRYDWRNPLGLGRKAQLYTYVDGGRVSNLEDGFGTGSLASAGGGIRADVSSTIDAGFEVAVPLTGPRYETGTREPRFNFRLLKLF
jgi:hemolysin activation/secretion protein